MVLHSKYLAWPELRLTGEWQCMCGRVAQKGFSNATFWSDLSLSFLLLCEGLPVVNLHTKISKVFLRECSIYRHTSLIWKQEWYWWTYYNSLDPMPRAFHQLQWERLSLFLLGRITTPIYQRWKRDSREVHEQGPTLSLGAFRIMGSRSGKETVKVTQTKEWRQSHCLPLWGNTSLIKSEWRFTLVRKTHNYKIPKGEIADTEKSR